MSFSWTWVWLPVTYIRAEPTSRVSRGQDPHFRLFRWRFQGVVLGRHFVHGCQKQAFWEERVLVAISLTGPSIHMVSLGCSAGQDPGQCWLIPGPGQSVRLTSRRACQRYDGQAFWEESYFRLQLAIHQASGICPMLPVSKGYVMSSLAFHFPIPQLIAFLVHIPQSNLFSGGIITLQPHLVIAFPVWLNVFQQSTEKYSSEY